MRSGGGPFDVCEKYSGKDFVYCWEQVQSCQEQEKSAAGEDVFLYESVSCDGRKLYSPNMPSCLSSVSYLIQNFGSCPRSGKAGLPAGVVLVDARVRPADLPASAIVVTGSAEDPKVAKTIQDIRTSNHDAKLFLIDVSKTLAVFDIIRLLGVKEEEAIAVAAGEGVFLFRREGDRFAPITLEAAMNLLDLIPLVEPKPAPAASPAPAVQPAPAKPAETAPLTPAALPPPPAASPAPPSPLPAETPKGPSPEELKLAEEERRKAWIRTLARATSSSQYSMVNPVLDIDHYRDRIAQVKRVFFTNTIDDEPFRMMISKEAGDVSVIDGQDPKGRELARLLGIPPLAPAERFHRWRVDGENGVVADGDLQGEWMSDREMISRRIAEHDGFNVHVIGEVEVALAAGEKAIYDNFDDLFAESSGRDWDEAIVVVGDPASGDATPLFERLDEEQKAIIGDNRPRLFIPHSERNRADKFLRRIEGLGSEKDFSIRAYRIRQVTTAKGKKWKAEPYRPAGFETVAAGVKQQAVFKKGSLVVIGALGDRDGARETRMLREQAVRGNADGKLAAPVATSRGVERRAVSRLYFISDLDMKRLYASKFEKPLVSTENTFVANFRKNPKRPQAYYAVADGSLVPVEVDQLSTISAVVSRNHQKEFVETLADRYAELSPESLIGPPPGGTVLHMPPKTEAVVAADPLGHVTTYDASSEEGAKDFVKMLDKQRRSFFLVVGSGADQKTKDLLAAAARASSDGKLSGELFLLDVQKGYAEDVEISSVDPRKPPVEGLKAILRDRMKDGGMAISVPPVIVRCERENGRWLCTPVKIPS